MKKHWFISAISLLLLGSCFDFGKYEAGGAIGQCGITSPDTNCNDCISGACATECAACSGGEACMGLLQCVWGCDNPDCRNACYDQYPNGADLFGAFESCYDANCRSTCEGGGGTGGTGGTGETGGTGATGGTGGSTGGSGASGGTGGTGGAVCGACDGCCSGTTCIPQSSTDWKACGIDGESCKTCERGAMCTVNGQCNNDYWDPNVTLRFRMGILEVTDDCDMLDACDPFICITFRNNKKCSSTCDNSNLCDYSKLATPFVVEGLFPSDFTDGELYIDVRDEEVTADMIIWSNTVTFSAPFKRANNYQLTPNGSLLQFQFQLEAM